MIGFRKHQIWSSVHGDVRFIVAFILGLIYIFGFSNIQDFQISLTLFMLILNKSVLINAKIHYRLHLLFYSVLQRFSEISGSS